ncbi:hypothetical protein [Desulfofustis limnaeus]|jgi:putative sterol carrier protein|uniref:SCP2 domain-containing protein n=1 Tax=Desulfofustis limnaeus TaxID=2740163 RepID=A0ABN6MB35_9BACT|nr:hypothetical protein [Desulfofustis limnaeus]MDX9896661.1 hypothetical protein [Desulfofustis sp.]BDD88302.1 hypothetical protein DPPLL_26670 [Desulfofustis limnaeus]
MIEQIFATLPEQFRASAVKAPVSYYFSLDDIKKTVVLSPDRCHVEHGRTIEAADCVCKTSTDFFLKIWEEDYRPGMGDFLTGKIKTNNPDLLKTFLAAFGKNA